MAKQELLKGLTKEQIAKIKACKNQEELLTLAKQEGVELSDEQLAAVSGGICTSTPTFVCPVCGSPRVKTNHYINDICEWYSNTCENCGKGWSVDK